MELRGRKKEKRRNSNEARKRINSKGAKTIRFEKRKNSNQKDNSSSHNNNNNNKKRWDKSISRWKMSTIPSINLNRAQEGYVNELGNHDRSYLIRLFGRFNCRETRAALLESFLAWTGSPVVSGWRWKENRKRKKKIRNAVWAQLGRRAWLAASHSLVTL